MFARLAAVAVAVTALAGFPQSSGQTARPAMTRVIEGTARVAGTPGHVPNDPWWGSEWGLARIGMPALWRALAAAPSDEAVVAVVDTGVDESRPDLAGAVVAGTASPDAIGHGTSVAEIIAGRGDDGVGAAGVCWRCRILPVDVAPSGVATGTSLATGIREAVARGADVVNISLVLSGPDAAVAAAIADAEAHGALVVAAAGNDGGTGPTYPAAYPGVVSVVAVDENDRPYSWSSHGSWATLAAPGCATIADAAGRPQQFCGSSAAAPVVSGLAGLLWSAGFSSADRVRAALSAAVTPVGRDVAGVGRVDAGALAARVSGG